MTKKRKAASPEPSPASRLLADVARMLDEAGIAYLLIGGQAVIEHGYIRTTEDIDFELVLSPWDVAHLKPLMERLGLDPKFPTAYEIAPQIQLLPVIDRESAVGVDFALAPSPYLELAIGRSARHTIAGYPVNVAAVEDLVIRKVIANRPRDRNDIDQLLLRHGERIDLAYLESWLTQFESVVDQPLLARFRELLDASRR